MFVASRFNQHSHASVTSSGVFGKRNSLRCPINGSVSIFDRISHYHLGLMIDINKKGLTLTSSIPLECGEEGKFKMIDMPNDCDFKRIGLFDAKPVVCHRLSPSIYTVDFEFTRVSEETQLMMATYQYIAD